MEPWRKVWREGLAPLLSDAGLRALHQALDNDDPRLLQGATTSPPPLMCVRDWPVESACLIAYAGWQGDGLNTVEEVEAFFARICFEMDQKLGRAGECRWLLNWYDEEPRQKVRLLLLAEIELELQTRSADGR